MSTPQMQSQNRRKRDQTKKAIDLAMQSRWSDAIALNQSIIDDFPDDLEAYNRLGKALTEIGRIRDAKVAFSSSLSLSPNNPIARKNLDRLHQLDDSYSAEPTFERTIDDTFIEEIGKTTVTALVNLEPPKVLLKEAPGHQMRLRLEEGIIKVTGLGGAFLGQVEPRLAARLVRLIKSGNRYEATVRSVGKEILLAIVREVYQHPSQTGVMSFPPKDIPFREMELMLPTAHETFDLGNEDTVKNWSTDDTGAEDDETFVPVNYHIINGTSAPHGDTGAG